MRDSVTLSIGEGLHLRRGNDRIVHAGMPSRNVYPMVQRKEKAFPYQMASAWNLFFSVRQQQITVDGVDMLMENVTATGITLRMVGAS